MTYFPRHVAALTVVSLGLLVAGCNKPGDKPADATSDTTADAKGTDGKSIPGLATEKEQVSYMIGLDLAKSLQPVKDEVDLDTLNKALKTALAGEKTLLDEKQAQAIRESFGQKMQAKQIAKAMADAKTNLESGNKFLTENGKKAGVVTTPSGLQYQVLSAGTGAKPVAKDGVKVHYKGSLLEGKTFDSSYDRGEPAEMPLDGVIPGWSEGLQLMPVGSKYKFWIPSTLAYGEQAPPTIGPNQVLVFEVELLEIVKPSAK